MRVLYLNTKFQGGGAERVARQLYEGIGAEGVESYMLVGKEDESDPRYEIIYGNLLRRRWNWVYGKLTSNARLDDRYAVKKILSCIRAHQIDLVHIHNIHGNYMGIRNVREIAAAVPVVWTLHDMWTFTGHCAYAGDCGHWETQKCGHCQDLAMFPKLYFDCASRLHRQKRQYFTENGITFVTPSRWLYQLVKKSFLGQERLYMINNGVDTESFYPGDKEKLREKYGIHTKKHVLLFLTNLLRNTMKGFSYLAEALRQLEHKERYLLLIVGKLEEIRDICQLYEVKTFGYIKEIGTLRDVYAMADLFLLPSMLENYPCVSLEAMACGTPVAAFKTGGIVEQVDEDTGWLVERGNAAALKDTIRLACQDGAALREKGERSRKKAEECFSQEKMLKEYRQLYEEALQGKQPPVL